MTDGASEIRKLAADLSAIGPRLVGPARGVFQEIGNRTAQEWAKNAKETSGVHGKHYPKSISAELAFSTNLTVEVGPDSSKKQGRMGRGFEFGSENQPPHLDGLKAMNVMEPLAEQWAADIIHGVILAAGASPTEMKQYTTKAGVTRMATQAQIDNWTRNR